MRKTLKDDHAARVEAADEAKAKADEEHRRAQVRRLVFLLHSEKRPRSAAWLADRAQIPKERVIEILDQLESEGAVASSGGEEGKAG